MRYIFSFYRLIGAKILIISNQCKVFLFVFYKINYRGKKWLSSYSRPGNAWSSLTIAVSDNLLLKTYCWHIWTGIGRKVTLRLHLETLNFPLCSFQYLGQTILASSSQTLSSKTQLESSKTQHDGYYRYSGEHIQFPDRPSPQTNSISQCPKEETLYSPY